MILAVGLPWAPTPCSTFYITTTRWSPCASRPGGSSSRGAAAPLTSGRCATRLADRLGRRVYVVHRLDPRNLGRAALRLHAGGAQGAVDGLRAAPGRQALLGTLSRHDGGRRRDRRARWSPSAAARSARRARPATGTPGTRGAPRARDARAGRMRASRASPPGGRWSASVVHRGRVPAALGAAAPGAGARRVDRASAGGRSRLRRGGVPAGAGSRARGRRRGKGVGRAPTPTRWSSDASRSTRR